VLAFIPLVAGEAVEQCSAGDASCRMRGDDSESSSALQVKGREPKHGQQQRGSKLIITNACGTDPMWIASMFREEHRARYPNNVKLEPGESVTFDMPVAESVVATRFWPKMGCDEHGSNCRMGSSGGPGQGCPPTGCAPPVDTKFEATWWDFNTAEPVDWWDTSGVDGYTLPYKLTLESGCPNGHSLDCSTLSLDDCPKDEVLNGEPKDLTLKYHGSEEKVGCYSPCGKLTYSNWGNRPWYAPQAYEAREYCCPTPPESPESCRAGPIEKTQFVKLFRKKCQGVYSYAYDDAVGLQTCPVGTTYNWTIFCPM